jgi:hypothetical protein
MLLLATNLVKIILAASMVFVVTGFVPPTASARAAAGYWPPCC